MKVDGEVKGNDGQVESLAVVTGASRGLGMHTALALAARDIHTICVTRRDADKDRLAALHPKLTPIVCDVTEPTAARQISHAVGLNANIRVLVNNAGIVPSPTTLADLDADAVAQAINTHCIAPLRLCQGLLPQLLRNGAATIVNVTSRWGTFAAVSQEPPGPQPRHYAYRISKAAQNMATLCLSQELNVYGIRVFGIHPGSLRTRLAAADASKAPEDAAEEIVELALSEDSTAETFIDLNGGTLSW